MTKRNYGSEVVIGILFTVFFISLSVILVINSRFLYSLDAKLLNLPEQTGYSQKVIEANYDALIDYCSPFYHGELRFPSLPSSKSALSHFSEVKVIFVSLYYIAFVSGLLLLLCIIKKHKARDYHYLKTASLTCIILPAIVGLASMINFNQTFIIFHKIMFSNDDWLFDPITDPIILLLPEEFFLFCAILIVALVLLGSGILYMIYRTKTRTNRKESFNET